MPNPSASRLIFLTGGTGFVGSHVVDQLLARGAQVTCTVRPSSNLRWLENKAAKPVIVDLSDRDGNLKEQVSGHDTVIHVAGAVKALSYEGFRQANAVMTEKLVRACLEASEPPSRFVLVSTLGACGPPPEGRAICEDQPMRPVTSYGRSKLEGERRAQELAGEIHLVVVRPTAVYGPRDTETLSMFQAARWGVLPALGGRRQVLNLAHVEDIAAGICLAANAEVPTGSCFNLGAADEHNMRDVAACLGAAAGRKVRLLPMPRRLLVGLATMSELSARVRGVPAMLNRQKVPELVSDWHVAIDGARKGLGYEPKISFPEGAKQTYAWYEQQGWL